MSSPYRFDHIHLVSKDPKATAQYYRRMFDAEMIESLTPEGKPRIDLKLGGVNIFIFRVEPGENLPAGPPDRYVGLDHFGLIVDNVDEAAAELKGRGAEFVAEPRTVRPGLRIAFIRGPENVRIEILERKG